MNAIKRAWWQTSMLVKGFKYNTRCTRCCVRHGGVDFRADDREARCCFLRRQRLLPTDEIIRLFAAAGVI